MKTEDYRSLLRFITIMLAVLFFEFSLPPKLYFFNLEIYQVFYILIIIFFAFFQMILTRIDTRAQLKSETPIKLTTGLCKFYGYTISGNLFLSLIEFKDNKVDFFNDGIYFLEDSQEIKSLSFGDVFTIDDGKDISVIEPSEVEERKIAILKWYTGS